MHYKKDFLQAEEKPGAGDEHESVPVRFHRHGNGSGNQQGDQYQQQMIAPASGVAAKVGPGSHAAKNDQADEVVGIDLAQSAVGNVEEQIVEERTNQRHRQADMLGNRSRRLAGGIAPEYVAGEQQQHGAGKCRAQPEPGTSAECGFVLPEHHRQVPQQQQEKSLA